MQKRHTDRQLYFSEETQSCRKYYIPFILTVLERMPSRVLEVGCGEGGNLLPFAEGGSEVVGVDLDTNKIKVAEKIFAEKGQKGRFIDSDIFGLEDLKSTFSLIIVHDVIEHIYDKVRFLNDMKRYLAPGGVMFIAFPAWQMPFGGHQQIAKSKIISHFPFLHLLPLCLYRRILKAAGEGQGTIDCLIDIRRTRCPIEKFYKVISDTGYEILGRQLYFINPNYEVKFGLKPRKLAGWVAAIPYLRNFFCTSCFFLCRPKGL